MANNRICLTCGKEYEYCNSCPSGLNNPVWKNIFHTENCKIVFETVSDYVQNVITKEDAKNKLQKCDISPKNNFIDKIQKIITEIETENNKKDLDNVATVNKKKSISGNKTKIDI